MEDVNAYIESGILELYVLGDLNAEERSAVEAMSKLHPEVKTELEKIEKTMMAMSVDLSVEPSGKVRDDFFNQLTFAEEREEGSVIPLVTPIAGEAKVIPLDNNNLIYYKYAFVACSTLLAVSIVAIINLSNNLKESKQQIAQLQSNNLTIANRVNYLDEKLNVSNHSLKMLTNPDVKMVALKGTDMAPDANIMIAFNPKEEKVMIDFTNMEMPKNDKDHQYQLWALVDGKPVDLGVFDVESGMAGLKDMKPIGTAQTFAVTLEPRGGSVNPTLEKLMVIGNI